MLVVLSLSLLLAPPAKAPAHLLDHALVAPTGSGGDSLDGASWPAIGAGLYAAMGAIDGGILGMGVGGLVANGVTQGPDAWGTGAVTGAVALGVVGGVSLGVAGYVLGVAAQARPALRNALVVGGIVGGVILFACASLVFTISAIEDLQRVFPARPP